MAGLQAIRGFVAIDDSLATAGQPTGESVLAH